MPIMIIGFFEEKKETGLIGGTIETKAQAHTDLEQRVSEEVNDAIEAVMNKYVGQAIITQFDHPTVEEKARQA